VSKSLLVNVKFNFELVIGREGREQRRGDFEIFRIQSKKGVAWK
jgi:hypothetical protein